MEASRIDSCMALAERAVSLGEKRGADYCDAYVFSEGTVSNQLGRTTSTLNSENEDRGISVRAIRNGRIGFSYASGLTARSMEKAVVDAMTLTRFGESMNPELLPASGSPSEDLRIYDREVAEMTPNEARLFVGNLSEQFHDLGFKVFSIHLQLFGWSECLVSSHGLSLSQDKTFALLEALLNYHEDRLSRFLCEATSVRNLDVVKSVRSFKEMVPRRLPKLKLGSYQGPVCLMPQALASLLRFSVASAVQADKAYSGDSILGRDLKGQECAGNLTLVDNARLVGRTYSTNFDADGFPTSKTVILERGVLENFLTDTRYSSRFDIPHTANAYREGYWIFPRIRAHNLEIVAPHSQDEFPVAVGNGIVIPSFENLPPPDSSLFRALCDDVYVVHQGEIVGKTGVTDCRFDTERFIANFDSTCGEPSQLWGATVPGGLSAGTTVQQLANPPGVARKSMID